MAPVRLFHHLAGRGRRVTKQRQAVLRVLHHTNSHPDASWIYQEVRSEIPQISLGTVYRTLKLLCDAGLIRELPYGDNHSRYDGNVMPHGHISCQLCGRVVDVPLLNQQELEIRAARESGFTVSTVRLEFEGVCPDCQTTSMLQAAQEERM